MIGSSGMTKTRSGQNRKNRGEGEQRREEILAATRRLFVKDGADNTTVRAIADAVGISSAAVYGYFPDKMALYAAVAESAFAELGRLFEAAQTIADPVERLCVMSKSYVEFGLSNPEAYEIAFAPHMVFRPGPNATEPNNFAVTAGSQVFDAFHRAVQQTPGLQSPDPTDDRLARVIWAAGHGIVSLSRSKADALPLPAESYVEVLIDWLLKKNSNRPT
jgi:AcrR family transcriptional regulator